MAKFKIDPEDQQIYDETLEGLDNDPIPEEEPEAQEQAVEEEYEEQAEEEPEEAVPTPVSEVQKKLRLAQYYELVLGNSLFEVKNAATEQVDSEVRDFIQTRMEALVGVESTKKDPSASFTEDEVAVLKHIAQGLLAKHQAKAEKAEAPRQVARPKARPPAPAAVEKPRAPRPAAPQVRQQQPPPPLRKEPPRAPPAPALRKAAVPQALVQTTQRAPPPRAPAQRPVPKSKVPAPAIPSQYRDDPTLTVRNGRVYVQARDAEGVPLYNGKHPVIRDITPSAQPVGVTPMPTPTDAQFNMISQQGVAMNMNRAVMAVGGAKVEQAILHAFTSQPQEQEDNESDRP